jgi:Skp family chaperone for outer membrane proteins
MKRLLIAAVILTAAAMQAEAQTPGSAATNAGRIGQHVDNANARGADNAPKVKANDKAYNAALRNLPDKQYDPWRGVR